MCLTGDHAQTLSLPFFLLNERLNARSLLYMPSINRERVREVDESKERGGDERRCHSIMALRFSKVHAT